MRRRWWRTAVLWVGCTLCVLIAVAYVVSAWWKIYLYLGPVSVFTVAGSANVLINNPFLPDTITFEHHYRITFDHHPLGLFPPWPAFARGGPLVMSVRFPLLALLAAVAVPTLLAWRFWPKPPKPGHCACGYNLTGNVSGRCPECGEGVGR